MKVILDCNIWISFLIGHHSGLMQHILTDSRFDIVVCNELLEELRDVCSRSKIRTYVSDEELDLFFRIIYAYCIPEEIKSKASYPIRDPKDLYLLSLAESVKADYLVSGDTDLLDVKQFKQTRILRLAEFRDGFFN